MRLAAFGLIALIFTDTVWAIMPFARTPAEDAMCKASISGRDTTDRGNWQHMHHYCDGLRFYNRAMANTTRRQDFNHYVKESISGFDYVLKHTSPNFYMRPEIVAGKARTLALAGRKAEAVTLYTRVIHETPTYVPAYLYLADYYATTDRTKALSLVSDGLRHNPGTKSLQRRYTELGGKLPYPAPVASEPEAASATPPAEKAAAPAVEAPAEQVATTPAPEAVASPPAIGSPKNPYCRFCPD